MPLIATKGAASAQGFGEFAQTTAPVYIEDVFSTYLYSGTGSSQTITNNIDLSGDGGLVWIKKRTFTVVGEHRLFDTARTANSGYLVTNSSNAQSGSGSNFSFNSTGFSYDYGNSGETLVSWTFRKAEKFFDVVTYTGNGTAGRTVSHNLGSTPGCIIVKSTSSTAWYVYHRSLGATKILTLDTIDPEITNSNYWNNTEPTSTVFTLGAASPVNGNGNTYVAYLFAHNAGGFGLTGSDNVISCGSYNYNATKITVDLGWEPQWLLVKEYFTGTTDVDRASWHITDNMRGMPMSGSARELRANASNAEVALSNITLTSTGFEATPGDWNAAPGGTNGKYIYIAIRRGPMKTPTTGTSVFTPDAAGNNASAGGLAFDAGFPVDWYIRGEKSGSNKFYGFTRLTGNEYLETTSTAAGATSSFADQFDSMTGIETTTGFDFSGQCAWLFRRAPGFFDVVCYTGTGSARTVTHNLGAVPELMIVKARTTATGNNNWVIYASSRGATEGAYFTTAAFQASSDFWNDTTPTSSVFSLGNGNVVNQNTITYVAYLFASVSGVSKVGSYTGTGALQTVNCGFTTGARFVLIKRTDSTGDWWVYDSARGISSGNDPYLFLNSTAAEVTNTNYVDTTSVGFQVTAAAPAGLNANGGNFIFLAVA